MLPQAPHGKASQIIDRRRSLLADTWNSCALLLVKLFAVIGINERLTGPMWHKPSCPEVVHHLCGAHFQKMIQAQGEVTCTCRLIICFFARQYLGEPSLVCPNLWKELPSLHAERPQLHPPNMCVFSSISFLVSQSAAAAAAAWFFFVWQVCLVGTFADKLCQWQTWCSTAKTHPELVALLHHRR